jgi:L-amino acid N-acyltransferase YncA
VISTDRESSSGRDTLSAMVGRTVGRDLLVVEVATPADAEAVAAIYAPYVDETAISFETELPSADEFGRRIADTLAGFPWLVCRKDGEVVGYAYGHAFATRAAYSWSVETSVYVRHDAHRLGIGSRLYGALLPILLEQGYRRAFAGVTLPNPGSVALHESLGFMPCGVYRNVGWKFGSWWDVGWWQLDLQPTPNPDPPEKPIPFPRLGLGGRDSID